MKKIKTFIILKKEVPEGFSNKLYTFYAVEYGYVYSFFGIEINKTQKWGKAYSSRNNPIQWRDLETGKPLKYSLSQQLDERLHRENAVVEHEL